MKRIILGLSLFICSISFSQIKVVELPDAEKVGKITPRGVKTIECEKLNDTYYFNYRDAKFTTIENWKTFKIKDIDNAFEGLYSLIQKGFEEMPKKDTMIETNDGFIWLNFEKFLGVKVISFRHSLDKTATVIGTTGQYNKKQVDKLFGKNK